MQAIFSDDSDDEVETFSPKKVEDPEKKVEVANTALSHLIAGDFLESLGKELGLEVPSESPSYSKSKAKNPAPQKETSIANAGGNANILPVENKSSSTRNAVSRTLVDRWMPDQMETAQEGKSQKNEFPPGNPLNGSDKYKETDKYKGQISRERSEEDERSKLPSRHHKNRSSNSSSEDERSRKRSRRHRYSSDSYRDSSSEYWDRHHSRSKGRSKGSSQEKSSSRRKHRKHRDRDSPSRSYCDTEKERTARKKDKKRWRD